MSTNRSSPTSCALALLLGGCLYVSTSGDATQPQLEPGEWLECTVVFYCGHERSERADDGCAGVVREREDELAAECLDAGARLLSSGACAGYLCAVSCTPSGVPCIIAHEEPAP